MGRKRHTHFLRDMLPFPVYTFLMSVLLPKS